MRERQVPVAIVGMAVLLPGAEDLDAYWRNLVDGVDAVREVPEGRWDPVYYRPGDPGGAADRIYCRRGGFVDGLAAIDAARFGLMPSSVAGTEPDQLIALSVAARALADAGGEERLPDRARVGVVLGRGGYLGPGLVRLDQRVRTAHQLTRTLGELLPHLGPGQLERVRAAFTETLGPEQPESAIGLVPNLAASRIANRLDLRGPAYTVDAACASSLIAVDQAVGELASGRCDLMLAGGVHHCHDITLWSVFAQLRALSPSERSRPFHAAADGILIGEGTGVVALKRLADAERDGDRVYAVIRGTGVAGDGRAAGLMNPDPGGQARAVRQAWRAAGLDPRDPASLGLLEAHGTGTPAGDAAELATLAEVFGPGADSAADAPVIGSVKSMIGHCMPAAGVAGLVKAALAVHHATLLPTLHCEDPHPALARTRFRPAPTARPWEGPLRRAAVNAFGFGGINAHVILEQAPDAVSAPRRAAVHEPERVLRLTAATPQDLARLLDADDTTVRERGAPSPYEPDTPAATRLGIVDPTAKRLALARRAVAQGRPWRGRGDVWFAPRPLLGESGGGKVAFVFPGLEAEFAPRVDEVAEHYGLRLPGRTYSGATDVARHGLGVLRVGRVLDEALRALGVQPDGVAGHSVGEWTAMIAGGMFAADRADDFFASFDPDSLKVPGLAFAAVGAPAAVVDRALADWPGLVLSHDNSPGQSMVCGPERPVEEFAAKLRAERVICQVLPFRSGFHTPMLAPYLGPLRRGVDAAEILPQRVPVWSGTTAAPFPAGPDEVRALFVRHLLEPVRFRPLVEALYAAGFRAFVQAGTGRLTSLIDDTLKTRDHLALSANSPRRGGLAQLLRVETGLWAEGYALKPRRPGGAARPAARPDRPRSAPIPLDLTAALVPLDPHRLHALRDELRPRGEEAEVPRAAGGLGEAVARSHPVAAELDALLRETADSVAAVLEAAGPPRATGAPGPGGLRPDVQSASGATAPPPEHRTRIRVSTETMPYLLDHCFFPQRPGWPEPADRHPVVPATTVLHHVMAAAERAAPGRRAVAVHDVRLEKWVNAIPAVDVTVTARPQGPGRWAVAFGPYARATVELAPGHPAPAPAPPLDTAGERPPDHAAAELYRDRWMFHGPAFQGVTALTGIGPGHVRGTITTPPAPGALLDNVGQLLGYWLMATRASRTVVFPVALERARFFGPHPPVGTPVRCHAVITSLTEDTLLADARLTLPDGTVWAELTGWRDRRFSGLDARRSGGYPEHLALAEARPGGWCLLRDQWPDPASRDLLMRTQLGRAEREAYATKPPRGRRQWLLGRIAAKDAVRRWLWEHGEGAVFPAEIEIVNEASGRPRAVGRHGRTLPPLELSLAHRGDLAVALVRPPGPGPYPYGVGIDVEEIADRTPETHRVALGPRERALLERLVAATGESRARWFTRFWAAKEAVAKAAATGLGGRPHAFEVTGAAPDALTVTVDGRRHHVPCALVTDTHVVAWTTSAPPTEESAP
ncbi:MULTISPECIES: beta-ketoacyl synthase N-terminal-like domain-containing protein [unclassified Streptomyces]|uniref:beta-ketoacyl synthase N-terminal-like domain-containing protein n=1 Tax=unclassified Streptomyces TaxID=2593676 RepID=UPI0033FE9F9F